MSAEQPRRRLRVLGAAGRDFHDGALLWRDEAGVPSVSFAAAQAVDGAATVCAKLAERAGR